jgi:hypothetical protein
MCGTRYTNSEEAAVKSEPTRSAKNDVLSTRIDAKTKFQIELMARVRGQRVSTVVERAIQESAEKDRWLEYWDADESVRWLKTVSGQPEFNTAEEFEKLNFTRIHWPFFYWGSEGLPRSSVRQLFTGILWPKIDEFVALWIRTKSSSPYFVAKAMQDQIRAAKITPPDWPPKPPVAAARGGGPSWEAPKGGDLDDEIPF